MTYCFQLLPHANIRYQEALHGLAKRELICMLRRLGLPEDVRMEQMGGALFLSFDAPELTDDQRRFLAGHSALTFWAAREDALLRPLDKPAADYFPAELPELPKYKGKTNAVFTRMMINLARCAAAPEAKEPLTVLDPLCGRGTTLFVGLQCGLHVIGADVDRRDLNEGADYLQRYLQYHRLKYGRRALGRTVGGQNVPEVSFTLAPDRARYAAGDTRTARFLLMDAGLAGAALKKTPAHLLVADLPYGIQHAPQDGRKPEPFIALLRRALPGWYQALRPGGAAALSFNRLTLDKPALLDAMTRAGFEPIMTPPCDDFSHEVEQAVTRDVVVARRP